MTKSILYQRISSNTLRLYIERKIANWIANCSLKLQTQRGYRMAIFANDLIGIDINQFGVYEGEELELLFDFFKPLQTVFSTGLVLDIGANIGNHAMVFSRRFATVHAFEPNPPTLELLNINTRYAGNVTVYGYGLGESPGTFDLVVDQANMGGSSITAQSQSGDQIIKVRVERLDDVNIDLSNLCFIKIDVEGFEASVLCGAERVLRQTQPLIVMEQHAKDFVAGNSTASIDFLTSLGYKFCWHQLRYVHRPWWQRKFLKLLTLATGEMHQIVSDANVPRGYYSMLIAVPPRFSQLLGLR